MSWRDRVAAIVEKRGGDELTKPPKPPCRPILSVLSVPTPPCFPEKGPASRLGVEARHARLIAMLRESPTIRYAVITDTEANPEAVIVALAIRGVATFEIKIPRDRFDPFALLDMAGKYSGTIH